MSYKLAIIGSRTFLDYALMVEKFGEIVQEYGFPSEIISGGAKGADSLAEDVAEFYSIPAIIYKADWDKYGKSAGPIRNKLICESSDMVLAFPVDQSSGTYQCLSLFNQAGKETRIYPTPAEW